MEIELNDIVKLNNNEEYIVESVLIIDNKKILLLREKNNKKLTFVKVIKENNQNVFVDLDDKEYKKALEKIS